MPEEVDAELEVVDRDPLVRRVHEPRRERGLHGLEREESVDRRAQLLADVVTVREARSDERREPRARLDPVDPRSGARARAASPSASACRRRARAGSTRAPIRRAVRRAGAPPSRPAPDPGGGGSPPRSRTSPGSRSASAMPRSSSVRALRRGAARRAAAASGCSSSARCRARSTGGTSPSTSSRNASTSGISERGGSRRRERLEQRAGLEERVVRGVWIGRVAAAAMETKPERRGHLLARCAEVVDPAAEDAALAASLVQSEVRRARVSGCSRASHDVPKSRPTSSSAVEREEEIAREPGALARERGEGDGGRRDMALHVERAATPDLAVDEVARPGVSRPLGRVRERPCRCAPSAGGSGRRPREASRRGSPARESSRRARPRRRFVAGTPPGASAARVSLPGGLTVSRRSSSWRSCVTSSRSVTPLRPASAR